MPDEIVLEYQNMIYKMSQKFYGVEKEDLIQAGFLGLNKAYKKFNPDNGAKFSTYAYGFIYGEMYEAATGNRPIRIRKNEFKIYKSVCRAKNLLENKYDRTISYEEACAYLHVDYTMFIQILNTLSASISIENTELNLKNKDNTDDVLMLKDSMNTLSPLEKNVIERRYWDDLSQHETAKVLGLSQVKVSRIEKKSREKMKNFIMS